MRFHFCIKPRNLFIFCLLQLIVCFWLHMKLFRTRLVYSGPECIFESETTDWDTLTFHNHNVPRCQAVFASIVQQSGNTIYRLHDTFINTSALDCHYTPFYGKYLDDYKLGECVKLGDSAVVNHEIVKVNCSYANEPVLEDYFAFFPDVPSKVRPPKESYNVLLLGIRSLSKFNLYRLMPQTLRWLRYGWGAMEFVKYHAIGRGILDNMAPLLTGLDVEQFNKTYGNENNRHFIWDEYASKGYRTIFAEDCAPHGIFGDHFFKQKPTDYFWSPFSRISLENTGNAGTKHCYRCLGNKMSYQRLLEHVKNAALVFENRTTPFFGLFWINSLTMSGYSEHDLRLIRTLDDEFKQFLERLYNIITDTTFLIFFSDTGYVQDDYGRSDDLPLGEYLPFLLIGFPAYFNNFHEFEYQSIRDNQEKLVTAFDVHKTLQDLMDFDAFRFRYVHHNYKSRAESLFDHVPKRMCKRVGIREDCACSFNENYFTQLLVY